MEDTRPLRLLSLDGGGIRGLSSLYVLRSIIHALESKVEDCAANDPAHRLPLPCEYFDLIAGTSTGGLIAIMLGALQMDVDTCIKEYLDMAPDIFPVEGIVSGSMLGKIVGVVRGKQRFDPTPLEEAIKNLVGKHLAGRATGGEDTPLQFEASRDNKSPRCKVFVCAASEKLRKHVRFRTYKSSWNIVDDCPIWQACRATSAAPTFFPPMVIGSPPTAYVDGGLGYNNPIRLLLDEARHIWPKRDIGCIVSIGTGMLLSKDVGRTIKPLFESLKDIATDTEKVAGEFREEMKHKYGVEQKVYFRFNVPHGLEQVKLEEWKEMDRTRVATEDYVMQEWSQIEACASQLHKPTVKISEPDFRVPFGLKGVPIATAFVGRNSELELMRRHLLPAAESNRRKICVLHGLGGIGKTQLAVEHARLHKDKYTSIFWLDGKTEDSLLRGILSVESQLPGSQVLTHDIKDIKGKEELKERAQGVLRWFALDGNCDWLLIFDNIDKTSTLEPRRGIESPTAYDVTSYFPGGDRGSIIITTRLKRLMRLGKSVQLSKLDILYGMMILETASGKTMNHSEDSDELRLVERLDGLPLALVLAGSFLASTGVSARNYLELYEKSWKEVNEEANVQNDYTNGTIATTWVVSYEELKHRDAGAAKLLKLWGYLDNQDLWFQLLKWPYYRPYAPEWLRQITATEVSFLRTLQILLDYSLIGQNEHSDGYSMHAVVHDWIREFINKESDDLFWIGIASVGLAVPLDTEKDYIIIGRRLLPHADRLSQSLHKINVLGDHPADIHDMSYLGGLFNLGLVYCDYGKQTEAETMFQWAMAGYEKALGSEHTLVLQTVNNLGNVYKDQGKLAEAETMFQWAMTGFEKALGPEHTSVLTTVNNLGNVYKDQGKLAEAEVMYRRAMAGYEKVLGPEHTSVLQTVNNLGNVYRNQGKLAEAEAMFQRAIAGEEKVLGSGHTSVLQAVNNLGNVYVDQGKLAEAEAMFQRAMAGYEKALGPEHTLVLRAVNNIGNVYKDQGKLAEAEAMFQRAIAGFEKALGPEHTLVLRAVNNIGNVYKDQGKLAEAETMFQWAMAGFEKALGPEHTSVLATVNNLGNVYKIQGKLAEAEAMFQRAIAGRKKVLGPEHPLTLRTVRNLDILYRDKEKADARGHVLADASGEGGGAGARTPVDSESSPQPKDPPLGPRRADQAGSHPAAAASGVRENTRARAPIGAENSQQPGKDVPMKRPCPSEHHPGKRRR